MDLTENSRPSASAPANRSKASSRTIWLSLGGISLVGGIASYLSTLVVIQAARGQAPMTYFEAFLADPTIAAASVNIVDAHRQGAKTPRLSIVSIVVAAVVTLGANYFVTDPHAVPKWLVNVWPPVAFLLAFESLMSYLRRGRGTEPEAVQATESPEMPCPHTVPETLDDAVRMAYEHGRDCERLAPKYVDLADRFSISRKRVAELVAPGAPEPSLNGSAP